ncbi:MAG: class I SAM-dependent methyltransferase, partial [Acidimicrobiales bacterium]|nr:class I SAM-dependent methyltransferase [Acidimicrobiales bacterium]
TLGWRGIGLANLGRAGYGDLVEHLDNPSHLALPNLIRDGVEVDFAFIDGWHTFDYVLIDFFLVDLLLAEGGVVAFDDAKDPAIRRALRYILSNRHYEVIEEQRVKPTTRPAKLRAIDAVSARSRRIAGLVSVEASVRQADLGLPNDRCIALRKLRHDVLGDGTDGSRRWNDHRPF